MRKLLKGTFTLVVLVAVAWAGWRWGPRVFPKLEALLGIERAEEASPPEPVPTPELADATLDRFEAFRAGKGGDRLTLGSLELTSVLRYGLPGILPPGVVSPSIELEEGKVELSARVAVDAFPDLPKLDGIIGLLPDTVLVQIRGSLVPYDQRHLALVVDRVQAARIPLPDRMVPQVLAGLGRQGRAGLADDALAVPLPDGLEAAYVLRDSLVMVAGS